MFSFSLKWSSENPRRQEWFHGTPSINPVPIGQSNTKMCGDCERRTQAMPNSHAAARPMTARAMCHRKQRHHRFSRFAFLKIFSAAGRNDAVKPRVYAARRSSRERTRRFRTGSHSERIARDTLCGAVRFQTIGAAIRRPHCAQGFWWGKSSDTAATMTLLPSAFFCLRIVASATRREFALLDPDSLSRQIHDISQALSCG